MCSSLMTRAAVTLSASLLVSSSKSLSCFSSFFSGTSSLDIRHRPLNLLGSVSPPLPNLTVTCWHVLRKEGKHKESKLERERERKRKEMMTSIHWRVSRGLSASHTSHSITRNTPLLPSFAKKISAKAFSSFDLAPPTQTFGHAQKTRQEKTLFSDRGGHSHHCFHSFILMTCFVFCHQISLTRKTRGKWA